MTDQSVWALGFSLVFLTLSYLAVKVGDRQWYSRMKKLNATDPVLAFAEFMSDI
jgi:hypothetical protein